MRSVPSSVSQQDKLREVVAHLGSALGQSDYTDDQIIIGHLRSAHDLALNVLRSGGIVSIFTLDRPNRHRRDGLSRRGLSGIAWVRLA